MSNLFFPVEVIATGSRFSRQNMKGLRGYFAVLPFITAAQTEGDIAYDYEDAYYDSYEDPEALGLEPVFDVPLINVTVVAGQSALLPCSIRHLGKNDVSWSDKDNVVLTLKEVRVIDDSRFSVVRPVVLAWNLQIRDVKWEDQGAYMCTVNSEPIKSKTAMLYVKVPPVIHDHLSTNDVIVEEGDTVVLICNVTGVPTPTVTWYRSPATRGYHGAQESKLCEPRAYGPGIGLNGEMIIITNVSRYCDDVYECRASNGVKPDVKRQIRVTVEFPPEIRMPVDAISQRRGLETILECKITGYPLAVTVWQRHGVDIENNAKFRTEVYDDGDGRTAMSLNLHVKHISERDFGEYSCVAKNAHGFAIGKIVLKEIIPENTKTISTTTKRIPVIIPGVPTPSRKIPHYGTRPKKPSSGNTVTKDTAPVPVVNPLTSSHTNNVHLSLLTLWSTLLLTVCVHYYQSRSEHLKSL